MRVNLPVTPCRRGRALRACRADLGRWRARIACAVNPTFDRRRIRESSLSIEKQLQGQVVRKSSRHLEVETAAGRLRCSLRGKFRQRRRGASILVGDLVTVTALGDGEGVVEAVSPRTTELTRSTAGGRPVAIAANIDQVLLVLSAREPSPRWALVDRVFVAAHRQNLDPAVFVNKLDRLVESPEEVRELERLLEVYRQLGYPAFAGSALSGEGLDALRDWLRDSITVLTGHSGVGKSTLLNALSPDLELVTGDVSQRTGKGRHTTTAVTLFPMPFPGFVADTPGFREFALAGVEAAEVGRFFPEFRPFIGACRFRNCLHVSEPGCQVLAAVDRGEISKSRYDGYLQIVAEA